MVALEFLDIAKGKQRFMQPSDADGEHHSFLKQGAEMVLGPGSSEEDIDELLKCTFTYRDEKDHKDSHYRTLRKSRAEQSPG